MPKNKRLQIAVFSVTLLLLGIGIVYVYSKNKSDSLTAYVTEPLSHEQFEEVKSHLVQLVVEKDPKASFDYLRKAIQNNAALARECHPLLHHIGHSAYEKYKSFDQAIVYQEGICNSGYTHGTIEAHFMASTDIRTTLQTTCGGQSEQSFQLWQCFHGIGHGVMYYTDKDLSQSLSMCENISSEFGRKACVNGVFMERFIIVSHTGAQAAATSGIGIALCKEQKEVYKPDCYFNAPIAYLEQHTNDYTGSFGHCQKAEKKHIKSCLEGAGSQAARENINNPTIANNLCSKLSEEYRTACVSGVVIAHINHHASTEPVEPLCKTVFSNNKNICQAIIASWQNYFPT